MAEEFEDKYEEVLQNIEFALVQVYRQHPDMLDWDAREGMNALVRSYQAEAQKRPAPRINLKLYSQEAYDGVKAMCEWRLGRSPMRDHQGKLLDSDMEPKSLDEIVACLKRINRSIETWNRELGRRGYYEFVSKYIQ